MRTATGQLVHHMSIPASPSQWAETWSCTGSYTVTQADIDNNGGGDGDIDNIATADSNETEPDTDDEAVPLDQLRR